MANNNAEYFELPDLITLEEFGGDFTAYLEAVYEIFKADYVKTQLYSEDNGWR